MSPKDILKLTRRRPFEPFKILVLDGTSYTVNHPENCMVLATTVVVGTPGGDIPESADWVDVRHIHKIIPLGPNYTIPDAKPQDNGPPDSDAQ